LASDTDAKSPIWRWFGQGGLVGHSVDVAGTTARGRASGHTARAGTTTAPARARASEHDGRAGTSGHDGGAGTSA